MSGLFKGATHKMEHFELSFCIPTYNRAESVLRLVTDILSCDDPKIEVVVLDNGSTDNTLEILREIKDKRLFVFSNGENRGFLYNMINVLNKGRGDYVVYSTDKDYTDYKAIPEFKSFLLQNTDLSCGFCTFDNKYNVEFDIFKKGYESIKNIAYKGRHPTGYFFNNKYLKSINMVVRFSDYDYVDLFPLEFVFAELCTMGNGAIYRKPIFKTETGKNVVLHKSATTNGKSKNAFFAPDTRAKLAINYVKHLNTLQIGQSEKEKLIIIIFNESLVAATKGYKSILKNNVLCIHYSMDCRNLSSIELFRIGYDYYDKFYNSIVNIYANNIFEKLKFRTLIFNTFFKNAIKIFVKFYK